MYIIIAGAGKVGYYLGKELQADGHEILVIERDYKRAQQAGSQLGEGAVMRGQADEAVTMERAGVTTRTISSSARWRGAVSTCRG